jgi:hypothetical protein
LIRSERSVDAAGLVVDIDDVVQAARGFIPKSGFERLPCERKPAREIA